MKTSLAAIASALALTLVASAQNVDLISLGSPTFTLDGGSTIGSGTQTTTGLVWSPSVALGDQLAGTFATADWTPYTNLLNYTGFALRMSVTGTNPDLFFSLTFYDPTFAPIATYGGSTFGLTSTPGLVSLSLNLPGTGDFSAVGGALLSWGGGGTINTTATEVVAVAVPEPSTYALLALGGLAFTGYAIRRRRRA